MKNQTLKTVGLAILTVIGLTACNGLSKLVKNADKITYKVTPNPMEMHGDSVGVSITGTYPEKLFPKKAIVTVTPVIKYNGGEKALKSVVLVGEKAEGKGTKIGYDKGGNFSYTSDKVAYMPEMKVATLELKATGAVKSKTKDLPAKKVADGIIITPLLVKTDDKPIAAKDNFQKTIPHSITGNIYFIINQSQVRTSEMNSAEMKAFGDFIMDGVAKGYTFNGMEVSAYASPDGELTKNANLAEDRAKEAIKTMITKAKTKTKDKKTLLDVATNDTFYNKTTTAEDWDGFKKAMEASSIADKDLILRVLTMYPDGEKRESEIKNLAVTYKEVSEKILPKLRRSILTLNAEEKSRTDSQLSTMAVTSSADSLSVEELLYSATLTSDINTKLTIYKKAEAKYGSDWRTSNNVGYIYILQNKLNDAEAEFKKADAAAPNNTTVKNNLGICARWKGDRKAAMDLFNASSTPEATYNKGIIEIQNGNYASAVSDMGSNLTFNAALAKLLSGNPDSVSGIIDGSFDKETAAAYYLKALAGARLNKIDLVITNLKTAIQKDASFKTMAKDDAEFIKIRDNVEYKGIVN